MTFSPRLVSILIYGTLLFLSGCAAPPAPQPAPPPQSPPVNSSAKQQARLDAALNAATKYLLKVQSPDGAWRSQTYGLLKDGPSLTPLVLQALLLQGDRLDVQPALQKGVDYLVRIAPKNDRDSEILIMSAAAACRVVGQLGQTPGHRRARAAWLKYVSERRLGKTLGWKVSDLEFGGWSLAMQIPRKPPRGQPVSKYFVPNMLSTVAAVEALRAAQVPAKARPARAVFEEILVAVKRCQNFAESPRQADPRFDDGGFYHQPRDEAENKAGIAGKDRFGRMRFRSYGSMTADGLRALLGCGLPAHHPRVQAALQWLERNFNAEKNPGAFPKDREVLREGTYYYYCQSVAHTFTLLNRREIATKTGKVQWAEALAEALLKRQRADGTWKNEFTEAKEDDPLIATMWAATALALCRRALTAEMRGKPKTSITPM